MHRRDPKIPDGSVWQHKRLFYHWQIVGYSTTCDRYRFLHLFPQYIMDQIPKEGFEVKQLPTGIISPEYLKRHFRRVSNESAQSWGVLVLQV